MSTKTFKYKPLYPGFDWEMTLNVAAPEVLFPEGVGLRADIRVNPGSAVLASISTEAGEIARTGGSQVSITIPGSKSAAFLPGAVVFDLVRTDTPSPQHYGIRIRVPVEKSVTDPNG